MERFIERSRTKRVNDNNEKLKYSTKKIHSNYCKIDIFRPNFMSLTPIYLKKKEKKTKLSHET